MGVTRPFEEIKPIRVEDLEHGAGDVPLIHPRFNYADYDFNESDDEHRALSVVSERTEDGEMILSRTKKNKDRRAERRMRRYLDGDCITDGVNMKKNMGARKWRRVENAQILMTLTERDDICEDFSDLMPRTVTAFEKLFIERESMKAWNEFVEKDETEQRRILEGGSWTSEETKGWFVVGGKSTPKKALKEEDGRRHHPAYSGKACFERLDNKNKQLLRKKRLNWTFINHIETELRDYFSLADRGGSPGGAVYIGRYPVPMERALLHAVSQYLMLKSKSMTDRETQERITEVRNPRAYFIPPREFLIPYLSSLRAESIEVIPWTIEEEPEGTQEDVEDRRSSASDEYVKVDDKGDVE